MANYMHIPMFQLPFFTMFILSLSILQAEVTGKISRLSNPLVGDDGRIYTCAEKNFFAFESNGSVAWKIRLGYFFHTDTAPAFDRNRKMRSSCGNVYTRDPICPKSRTQVVVLIVLSGFVRFCCLFWGKKKLQDQDLDEFLWKRLSLRTRKKAYDEIIAELEVKASADPTDEQVLEQMHEIMQERREIERKLSTTYSLGRDGHDIPFNTLLPLQQTKLGESHSFQRSKNRSMSIFNTLSATSSDEQEEEGGGDGNAIYYCEDKGSAPKMKEPMEIEHNELDSRVQLRRMASDEGKYCQPTYSLSGSGFTNPLFDDGTLTDEIMNDVENGREMIQQHGSRGSGCLQRRSMTPTG